MKNSLALLALSMTTSPLLAKAIDPATLCTRLQITEEVIVMSKEGDRIIDLHRNVRAPSNALAKEDAADEGDAVCRRGSSSGQTSSSFDGPIFFHHEWTVKKDGTLSVTYEQGSEFEGRGRDAALKNSTGKKTMAVKDFDVVSWVSPFHKNQRVIVRLVPTLTQPMRTRELGKFPLFLEDAVVFDGAGRLWTANLSAFGDYIGVLTVQGGLVLSLQPFEQGKKLGTVQGHELRFKLEDGTSVLLKNSNVILPGDLSAAVYVYFDPSIKAKNFGSQSVSSGGDAADTLARLRKHAAK